MSPWRSNYRSSSSFDTGAENSILFNRELSDILGIDYSMRIPIYGADLSQTLYALVARSIDIEVTGMQNNQVDLLVLEDRYFDISSKIGLSVHGLLGGNFFRNSIVEIDYKNQVITFHSMNGFKPPRGNYHRAEVLIRKNKPYYDTRATLLNGTELDLRLLLDTGAGLPLMLHSNTHPDITPPEQSIAGQLGMGLGGYVLGYIGYIENLQVLDVKLERVLTSFQDINSGVLKDTVFIRNGLIGNQMLSRFRVIIDYIDGVIYLKPGPRHKRKFKMDRSGMIVFAHGQDLDEFIVQDIIDGSPAHEAGVQRGDQIVRIQGVAAASYTLDHIAKITQKRVGKKIKLVVQRGDERIKLQFRLKNLI